MFIVRLVLAALICAQASPLLAQGVYVTGGWVQVWREPAWAPSLATPTEPAASPVPTGVVGVGKWFGHAALEGTLGVSVAQSVPWQWRYLFGGTASNQVATDRDVPLTAALRVVAVRGRRVSLEPLIGGGVNVHPGRSYIVATCGPASNPTACVPVERTESDALTSNEWLLMFGADLPVRAGRRFDIVPGFRFSYMKRRQFLTGYDHRGPAVGGGALPGFGLTARYWLRSR